MSFVIPKKGYIVGKLCEYLYESIFKNKQYRSEMLKSYNLNLNQNIKLLSDEMKIWKEQKDNINEEGQE